jgi:hypothetical protein
LLLVASSFSFDVCTFVLSVSSLLLGLFSSSLAIGALDDWFCFSSVEESSFLLLCFFDRLLPRDEPDDLSPPSFYTESNGSRASTDMGELVFGDSLSCFLDLLAFASVEEETDFLTGVLPSLKFLLLIIIIE